MKFFEQAVQCNGELIIGNHARDEAETASFRRVDLLASEDQMRGGAHSNKVRQRNHRDRRKAAELDFRLAELRRFCG